ncbi:lysozyme inhibitor LprI family protein [Pseudooceanicola sp. C21-150M6]|uniref:lysozyme inhibitor LprI family protein n=1 Tax=Pseudooceanicola sp. C21-150M6 TaxID=3434355 RepID=UPI003D7FBB28
MKRINVIALIACQMIPVTAYAQAGPAFDCAKAGSSAEKLVCDDPALAALDRRLAERFGEALTVAKGLDAGAKEAEDLLRATQRGWIKGRDECWKEPDLRSCVHTEYLRREAELVAGSMLEEPSEVREWKCGDGMRRLTIYTFDTELPAIRVEEGDSIYTGALLSADTPGAFYVSQWGDVSLGDGTAQVSDVYGKTSDCRPAG